MPDLVFVTHNQHKLIEIQDVFLNHRSEFPHLSDFRILDLHSIGYREDIPETSDTLEGNALLKARTIFSRTRINCFADDTGLEVEAIGGLPGVQSARYAGEEKSFEKNIDKLLHELAGQVNRRARFRTVIALILNGSEVTFEGIAEGRIIEYRRGTGGFGYDPVFLPDHYDQTFAEMPLSAKNRISHRYKAMTRLMFYLNQMQIPKIHP